MIAVAKTRIKGNAGSVVTLANEDTILKMAYYDQDNLLTWNIEGKPQYDMDKLIYSFPIRLEDDYELYKMFETFFQNIKDGEFLIDYGALWQNCKTVEEYEEKVKEKEDERDQQIVSPAYYGGDLNSIMYDSDYGKIGSSTFPPTKLVIKKREFEIIIEMEVDYVLAFSNHYPKRATVSFKNWKISPNVYMMPFVQFQRDLLALDEEDVHQYAIEEYLVRLIRGYNDR